MFSGYGANLYSSGVGIDSRYMSRKSRFVKAYEATFKATITTINTEERRGGRIPACISQIIPSSGWYTDVYTATDVTPRQIPILTI
jgi:hypothetical protein